ncbi:unnamed protein product [Acanthoscelides obtectus]|uniref:tRNA (adenine(58)-N(1))-methyltransferase non-catalytic subunit TRM6 n=1 Tax=Acanthoscelides obtectus TaxID=200917 RepID=A0A9P0LDI9_ACAOB|nr:unnamed protein product [Acanthoscelides obtectus]CAK1662450.1 tRNA (adenine(58)-N(1))-methyltransferase non-catalytic subunit TRM6 [Acanthoscelides obtectus]
MENANEDTNKIKVGDFVIVQRQGYTKLHKIKAQSNLILGSFHIEMDNVIGERYFDTFQMKNTSNSKKFYTLEKVNEVNSVVESLNIEKSGTDNRHIQVNAESQGLSKEDIDKLKDEQFGSSNIVEQLVNNSKTFNMKTEYSQEKYLKKKEKKYFEYIVIRRPTIRLLAQMFYRQDPTKTLGIRVDDLSQILNHANIHPEGNHLLYDSGTSGLLPAAITNLIGSKTEGHLIHMHPGNECQKNAFMAMQFPQEQVERCTNVNLYSVLRCFYQNKDSYKKTQDTEIDNSCEEPAQKKIKVEDGEEQLPKKSWQIDNERACRILSNRVDSLIITSKEHPVNITKELLQFLNGNRQFVVFNILKEPLMDLYNYLKSREDIISIRLCNNFMRNYQVLPERTHPEVNMCSGGYILTAYKLSC